VIIGVRLLVISIEFMVCPLRWVIVERLFVLLHKQEAWGAGNRRESI
jgi:hypothetical protein